MNISMIVIGHLTNPYDLEGGFSVQFSADDFLANGASSRQTSRGFNLSVDAGGAKASAIHFVIVRLSDGLRIEGFVECVPGRRNFLSKESHFNAPGWSQSVGRFESFLHWDGSHGVFTAHFTVPRDVTANSKMMAEARHA